MTESQETVVEQQSDFQMDGMNSEPQKKKRSMAKYIVVRRSDDDKSTHLQHGQIGHIGQIVIDVEDNITRKADIPNAIRSKGMSGEFEFFKSIGGMKIATVRQEKVW